MNHTELHNLNFFSWMQELGQTELRINEKLAFEKLSQEWPISEEKFVLLKPLLPKHWQFRGPYGEVICFEMSYFPEFKNGRVEQMLVILTDQTEINRLKIVENELKELEAQGLVRILEVRKCRSEFASVYRDDFNRMISEIQKACSEKNRDEVKKCLLSIKGNSRIAGFSKLASIACEFEEKLGSEWAKSSDPFEVICIEIENEWSEIEELLSTMVLKKNKASDQGDKDLTLHLRKRISRLQNNLNIKNPNEIDLTDRHRIQWAIERLNCTPKEELVSFIEEQIKLLKLTTGLSPEVEIQIDEIYLDSARKGILQDCIMYILNNCFVHGLESPEERSKQGKSEQGRVSISIRLVHGDILLTIEDDGRGFSIPLIRERAMQLSLLPFDQIMAMPEDKIIQLIFEFEFLTGDLTADVVGRGIGLSKVREKLFEMKGEISAQARSPHGARFLLSMSRLGDTQSRALTRLQTFAEQFRSLAENCLGISPRLTGDARAFLAIDTQVTLSALICQLAHFGFEKIVDLEIVIKAPGTMQISCRRASAPVSTAEMFTEFQLADFVSKINLQRNRFDVVTREDTMRIVTSSYITSNSLPKIGVYGNSRIAAGIREPLFTMLLTEAKTLGIALDFEYGNFPDSEVFFIADSETNIKCIFTFEDTPAQIEEKLLSFLSKKFKLDSWYRHSS